MRPACFRGTIFAACFLLAAVPVGVWNRELFTLINGANSAWGDGLIGFVSGFGDGLVIALIISCVMLFRLRLGIAALIAFAGSGLIAQLLKRVFDMPRPPAVLESVHLLGDALQSHSFPSGHATSCGVMLLMAFMLWKRDQWQAWAFAGLFAMAAYGRIYGGVHFPLDVWAGAGIGMATMSAAQHWVMRWPKGAWEESEWAWKVPAVILMIEAAVLGLGYRIQPSTALPVTLLMPIAALVILMRFWKGKFNNE
ncbi:MAG: phosphatase PAP2 family protein [Mariprofundaceae bacterium]|nr:phosphatase PAP2 family protein [Mariprofundaceae bacterium]